MSGMQAPPAGWTLSRFKAVCADVGSWTWGTVQGAFNEKASITQIIVDAVIGMIPLVGDATAVRDLIAVVIGLSTDEKKRDSRWEWVLLVVLLFALIPVFGGVVKGVGRLILKLSKEAAHLTGAARIAHLRSGGREIIEFLNRIGMRNAEKWFQSLRIADHSVELSQKFTNLVVTVDSILKKVRPRISAFPSLSSRIDSLRMGLKKVLEKGHEMIPVAIKELDQQLREIQAFIRSGGETTSRLALHEVATGSRVTTRAAERKLIEDGVLPVRNSRGGFSQNPSAATDPAKIAKFYKHEPGYPSLLDSSPTARKHEKLEAFSGKITNRQLKDGEKIYRFFGPQRSTHGVHVDEASASGGWWGIGLPPQTAKEWRELAAVLDSFNGDGFFVTATVVGKNGPKAAIGTVSEQFGKRIPGQYLPGGTTQAFFYLERAFSDALRKAGQDFISGTGTRKMFDPATGMEFTFHSTGWKDANGIWGYIRGPGTTAVQTARVGSRERATKENREVIVHP
jgi:hypothetical protein